MNMICISYREMGDRFRLSMKGHADAEKPGEPNLICASASTLAYTLLGALTNLSKDALLQFRIHSGDYYIDGTYKDETKPVIQTALIGFMQLAKTYPDNVSIQIDGKAV